MNFVLEQEFKFEAPVHVRRPGGAVQSFTGVFRVIPITPETKEIDIVDAFEGWSGVELADKSQLPSTPENRVKLLQWPFVRAAIVHAYIREVHAVPEKNSEPPAAPGPAPAPRANGAAAS